MLDETSLSIAGDIWKAIGASKKILLHCHVSPDGDSIGSTLAMYHALKGMGKDVTAIWGDSGPVEQFSFLPGFGEIVNKNYFEIDPEQFDLFLSQDAGSLGMISRKGEVIFPPHMRVAVIDHHDSNTKYGEINLVLPERGSVCEIIFELFTFWKVAITPEMALCMMFGMYTDTGGFKYESTSPRTFQIMSELSLIQKQFSKYFSLFENANAFGRVAFQGLALNSIESFYGGKVLITSVSFSQLQEKGMTEADTQKQPIANLLKSIKGTEIGIQMTETGSNVVKMSFRTRDADKYDVAKLAEKVGGGGHKAASGAVLEMPLEEAKKKVLEKIGELYPDLK